jgi:hypothetical protein
MLLAVLYGSEMASNKNFAYIIWALYYYSGTALASVVAYFLPAWRAQMTVNLVISGVYFIL